MPQHSQTPVSSKWLTFRQRFREAVDGASGGQAIVETAIALPMMVIMFSVLVSAGQLIGYSEGLTNAAAAGARAATQAATKSADPVAAAVAAVNEEQGTTVWSACSGGVSAPCVQVSAVSHSTGSATSVTIQTVSLHGTFSPAVNLVGLAVPITVSAGSAE